jgi:hypothetical protein
MGGACARMGPMKMHTERLGGKEHFKDLDVDGR